MANKAEYEDKMGRLLEVAKNDPDEARRQQATDYLRQLRSEYDALPVDEEVSTEQPAGEPMSYGDLIAANVKETAKGVGRGLLGVADLIPTALNAIVSDASVQNSPFGLIYEQVTGEKADVPDWLRIMPVTDAISYLTGTDVRGALAQDKSVQVPGAPDPAFMGTVSEYMAPGVALPAAAQSYARSVNTVPGSNLMTRRPGDIGSVLAQDAGFVGREAAMSAPVALAGATAREMGASPLMEAAVALPTAVLTGAGTAAVQNATSRVKPVDAAVSAQAERQMGEAMLKTIDDVDALVETANRNRQQLIDAGVIQRDDVINTFTLTENPALATMVNKIAQADAKMVSSINDMGSFLDTQLAAGTEKLIPEGSRGAGAGSRIVQTVTDRVRGAQERFTGFVDATTQRLDELRSQYADGVLPSEISKQFSASMKQAFDTAKSTEAKLWANVDQLQLQLDPKQLRTAVNAWFDSKKNMPYFEGTIPKEVKGPAFKFAANPTPENYQIFMSELKDARAQAYNAGTNRKGYLLNELFELVDGQVSRLSDNDAYQAAVDFTRQVYKTFDPEKLGRYIDTTKQGNLKLDPEVALTQIIKPGADVGELRRLIELDNSGIGGAAVGEARQSIEDAFYQMFGRAENKQKFLSEYGDLLNKFPTMAINLRNHADEIDRLADSIAKAEGRAVGLADKKKVAVSVFLGADPDNLVPVISKINSKDLPKLVKFFERSGLAEEFQGVYLDRIVRKITEGDKAKAFSLGDLLRSDSVVRAGWNNVLTPKQKEYISMLERFGSMSGKTTGYSAAINKELKELMTGNAKTVLLARAMAVRLSSFFVPSGPGSIQTAAIAANFAKRAVNGLKESEVTSILNRMLKDPEYFEDVLRQANKEKTLSSKVDAFLGGMGVQQVPLARAEDERQRRRGNPMGRPTPPPQPQPGMLTGM